MGLFDSIAGDLLGSISNVSAEHHAGLLDAVSGLLNNPQVGGVSGLIGAFEKQGLGSVIASWVGSGQNLQISPEQIQAVLGEEHIQGIAQKLGLSTQDVASHLSQLLPSIIDKMTPNGQVPAQQDVGGLMGMLKGALS
ncbi:MAG: DUF937 domain-containing protein [Burkholderiales bacterium]|nr:DUF937 domain-containing protein [Burkholderiales bacterium]MDE2076823.1 DUF937 domain-containing protein [Burkholderiales bacterium]MDE2432011.1 DUF937 domain-containing protein [Burkholderiales bacterium]